MNKLVNICLQITVVTLAMDLTTPVNAADGTLLESYLPVTMQALAYYIDLLQYEPIETTTMYPPFSIDDELEEKTTSTTTTTLKPTTKKTTTSWFQSPSWWMSTHATGTSTTTENPIPTRKHKPGLYAPITAEELYSSLNKKGLTSSNEPEPDLKSPFDTDAAFTLWLKRQKQQQHNVITDELTGGDDDVLDQLPLSLVRDIDTELDEQNKLPAIENLDNFLKNYDDSYGKQNSRAQPGKKRTPPTKPYVDFLLIYDLLKRDAKAANFSQYTGYTEKMIQELYELSDVSPQQQLYTILKRMLDRKEIQRTDVVSRSQRLLKELANPKSVISESLKYFPPLRFIP